MRGTGLAWQDMLVVLLYLAGMIGIGVYFRRRERSKDTEEYLLGGRDMSWWLIGIAFIMTLLSTNSLVGVPGEAFNFGLAMSVRYVLSPLVGIGMFYVFTRFFFRTRVFTPFTYLEERFDRRVRVLGSLSFIVIRLFYLGLVLYSSSKVLEGVAGWPAVQSIFVIGVVGLIYVFMGGMKAVVWADFAQFLILVGGLALVAGICMFRVDGGFFGIFDYAYGHGRGFDTFQNPDFWKLDPYVRLNFWLLSFAMIMDRLFYASGDQLSVQRLLATSSYTEAKRSIWFSQLITIPVMLSLWFLGLAIFAYYGQNPPEGGPLQGDTALYFFVGTELPPFVVGLFVAANLGAIMSTLDGGFHSLATVMIKDIYLLSGRASADEHNQVRLSRILIVIVGIFSMGMALFMVATSGKLSGSFMEMQIFWMSFQGIVAVVFLIGVLSKRVTASDILRAFAVAAVATAVSIVIYIRSREAGEPLSFLFISVPGEIAMLVFGFLPALWRKPLPAEKTTGLTLFRRRESSDSDRRP